MALPATSIALSAVNTELGNASAASINLNNPRVRSLGGVSTAGTTFSIGDLANQSGTWIFGINISQDFVNPSSYGLGYISTPSTDQSSYYMVYRGDYSTNYLQVRKLFVNGTTDQITQFTIETIYSLACGALSTSNVYFIGDTGPVKITAGGAFVSAKYISGTLSGYHDNLVLDSSENLYFVLDEAIGAYNQDVVVSFDSSLNFRWAKYLPDSATASWSYGKMGVDSSNNLYTQCGSYTGNTNNRVGYLKFNSGGTLLQQIEGYIDSTPANDYYSHSGSVNSSGNFVLGITKNLNLYGQEAPGVIFFNSSGVIQWVKTLDAPAAFFGAFYFQKAVIDNNSNVYVISTYDDLVANNKPLLITKLNSSGTVLWNRRLTGGYTYPAPTGYQAFNLIGAKDCFLTGSNQELLNLGIIPGYQDFYYAYYDNTMITVKTDGSGTGTYSVSGRTFYYTSISVSATSRSFTTTAPTSLVSRSYTPTSTSRSLTTPTSFSTYKVNVS